MMFLGSSLVVLADTAVSGTYGDYSWEYDDDSKTLTFSGSGTLNIPYGYMERNDAETIVIPEGCSELTNSTLLAFRNSQVKNYIVSTDNETYATSDGVLYTKDMKKLLDYPSNNTRTSFVLPDSVVEIEGDAFSEASNLESVTLPDNLQIIGCNAFYHAGLTSLTIPKSVYRIYDQAFANCSSLASIQVESSKYGSYYSDEGVLYSSERYTNADTGEEIVICALECYPAGKSGATFSVPSGVTEIGMNAFRGANQLQTVKLPMTVTRISAWAFEGTESLVEFYIPSSVTTIIGVDGTTGEDCGIAGKENAIIYGKSGSVAEKYAVNNNIKFIVTEETGENEISAKPTTPVLTKEVGQKALQISAKSLPLQLKKTTNVMKSGASLNCTVTVQKKAVKTKKLTLSKTKVTLNKGKSYTITVTKNPLTSLEKVSFKSSNKKVATVSSKGKIVAKKKETAIITVKTSGGAKKTCKVTVK